MHTQQLAVEAEGLHRSFGAGEVLGGVDLAVPRGSVFALLGPNGAGKTTTVRILATLSAADSGRARVAGLDVRARRTAVRRLISLTGQYAAVDEAQTGEENLRTVARLRGYRGRAARRRAAELLEEFGLAEAGGRRVATYSGGMRRRLDLAAGLVTRPEVVFLDEPTTGLDPRSRRDLWELVETLAQDPQHPVTVFLTTQYLEEADRLADRVALLDGGRIAASGTPEELKARVGGARLELTLRGPDAYADALLRLGERARETDPGALTLAVPTDGSGPQVRGLLDELDPQRTEVARFAVRTATLDDVFLSLTGGAPPAAGGRAAEEHARV
ncbi:ATP-binding cassette domain-containing protein [Streptomyces xiaopingdaonensis]|uniref:ATP-binding cassette domain-containing protein n=1 Tax=Streptomyces xiaopingdaonensis TaxID=1565415 RepID=UPI0002DA22AB|nr:ATP-binding cassette domain-containing protein [Streptomyces xiaopingdaonensis]